VDPAAVERASQAWRRKKEELDARLTELEGRRRELVAGLEEMIGRARDCSREGAMTAAPGQRCPRLPGAGDRPSREAALEQFPAGREQELDCCLQLLKLRCQAIAEELVEVMLLAEALYVLARPATTIPHAGNGAGTAASAPPATAPASPTPATAPAAPDSARATPAPSPDALASIISSPQFQKIAAQLLTHMIKK